MSVIFEQKGWENTPETARLVCEYAKEKGIRHIVIASKTGYTTDIFLDTFAREGVEALSALKRLTTQVGFDLHVFRRSPA